MLRTCRLLLAKGAFHSIRKSEIFFRFPDYKEELQAKISGLTVKRRAFLLLNTFVGTKCSIQVTPFPMFSLGESSRRSELTFLVVVVPRGAWELGSQREDQDLSVAWGIDGLLWLSPGGLGIRIPERGLGPRCSLGT